MASEALGSGARSSLHRAAGWTWLDVACACLFWTAWAWKREGGKCGADNLKFEEVTFAGMGGGIHVEGGWHRWMSHVVNLMKATVFNHSPNSISPALFSSFIRI